MRRVTGIFGGDPKPPAGGNPDSNTLISDMTTVRIRLCLCLCLGWWVTSWWWTGGLVGCGVVPVGRSPPPCDSLGLARTQLAGARLGLARLRLAGARLGLARTQLACGSPSPPVHHHLLTPYSPPSFIIIILGHLPGRLPLPRPRGKEGRQGHRPRPRGPEL